MYKIAKENSAVHLICWCDDPHCSTFIKMEIHPGTEETHGPHEEFTKQMLHHGWFMRWDKHLCPEHHLAHRAAVDKTIPRIHTPSGKLAVVTN